MILIGNCETSLEQQFKKRIAMYLRREVIKAEGYSQILSGIENPKIKVVVLDISGDFEKRNLIYSSIREVTNKTIIFLVDKTQEDKVALESMKRDVYFFSKETELSFFIKLLDNIFIDILKEYSYREFNVNFEKEIFIINGKQIPFTEIEQRLCVLLIRNRNIYCSKDKIRREVWGWGKKTSESNINFHICNLRRKLDSYGKHIKNKRGLGYSWSED